MTTREARERQWARQWAAAGAALDEVRARQLRALSEDEALRTIEDLLSTVTPADRSPARHASSGLVDLQRLLHRRSPR